MKVTVIVIMSWPWQYHHFLLQARNEKGDRFDVEIDSKLFSAPSNIYIPNPLYRASVNDSNDGKGTSLYLVYWLASFHAYA